MAKLTQEQLAKLKELGQKLPPLNAGLIGGPNKGFSPGGGFYYVR